MIETDMYPRSGIRCVSHMCWWGDGSGTGPDIAACEKMWPSVREVSVDRDDGEYIERHADSRKASEYSSVGLFSTILFAPTVEFS